MKRDVLLEAEAISKSFYDPKEIELLASISLKVHSGEAVAIMGQSGQGKSTLLQILGTLEEPTRGLLRIANKKVVKSNSPKIRAHHIGFVFQSFHLLEDYTTLENVLMPARIVRNNIAKGSPAYIRACELLKSVGLGQRLDYPIKLLSGGEKQRAAIARALCNDPELILADEPSGNLDHLNSELIHNMLINLSKEQNKGLIIVTHNQELAALCDSVYELRDKLLHRSR